MTLTELPALAAELAARVRAAGFRPDLLVYIESGARLPAWELGRALGIRAVAVEARRPGHRLKRLLAPLTGILPRSLTDALRRMEERSGVHRRTGRRVALPQGADFRGKAILLLDDAADTGITLAAVKQALISRGADSARLRTAVLAATTPAALAQVDFHLLTRNSVLPWSPESRERSTARALMRQRRPPAP